MELKTYITEYLSNLYQVEDEVKAMHRNYPEFGFIIHIGDFTSVESFNITEWTEFMENGTIDQELKKRSEFIEYKFTSAGYSRENGGKSRWNIKKPDKRSK